MHPDLSIFANTCTALSSLEFVLKQKAQLVHVDLTAAVYIDEMESLTNLGLIDASLIGGDTLNVWLEVEEIILTGLH